MSNDRPGAAAARHDDYRRQAVTHFAHRTEEPGDKPARSRADTVEDTVTAALLLAALLLPWNIHFGVGVPESALWLFGVVIAVTLLSAASLVLHRHRRALNAPYLAVAAAFAVFAIVDAVRVGGTGDVPAGIGPGVLAGLAAALLASRPGRQGEGTEKLTAVRILGLASMVLATLAVVFNFYWRVRYVVPKIGDSDYGSGNTAVVATAAAYGVVALVVVLVGLRWLLDSTATARLATLGLGASVLLGAVAVWTVGIGRDIDAFHGIAQTTSTTGVGFEGYLAWVAAAAIAGPPVLIAASARPVDEDAWRGAARKCLSLIAFWFVGCAVLRVFDMISTAALGLPLSPYDSVGLLAFDVVAAAVAVWVRVNMRNAALHPTVIAAVCGVLFVLSVCRVAVGVGLAPRILYEGPVAVDASVFGNSLAQQITSTFDVVMCWLALLVAAVALLVLRRDDASRPEPAVARPQAAAPVPAQQVEEPSTQVVAGTPRWSAPQTQRVTTSVPRIARTDDTATHHISQPAEDSTQRLSPKIARVLDASTQRFAAGTTYTGTGRRQDDSSGNSPR
ncbi:MAG: hypothetical protein AB1925_04025 [Actinomycetota bacterium]